MAPRDLLTSDVPKERVPGTMSSRVALLRRLSADESQWAWRATSLVPISLYPELRFGMNTSFPRSRRWSSHVQSTPALRSPDSHLVPPSGAMAITAHWSRTELREV
jgi:hypothetical protein